MIKIYNTLTGVEEEFKPREDKKVYMYVCGVTPYDYPHLGHARSAIVYDIIKKYLKYRGFEVFHITNFTDVDDKIIKRAKETNTTAKELSNKFIEIFYNNMDALNVERANLYPLATEHIKEMIDMIQALLEKGYAYETEDGVYFEVRKFENYGKLSKRNPDEMLAGARVEIDEKKKDPLDFALWKKSKDIPNWDSPWGKGRPGWHIECSVMSMKYLGFGFDIHGGGEDLIFPHHENEIAQSESYYGSSPFVKYWLHNGLVKINSERMGKSLGNFVTISDILNVYDSKTIRMFLASTSYRKPLDYTEENLEQATKNYIRVKNFVQLLEGIKQSKKAGNISSLIKEKVENLKTSFIKAMDDDFNTSLALSYIFEFIKEINKLISEENVNAKESILILDEFLKIMKVFGLEDFKKSELRIGLKEGFLLIVRDLAKMGIIPEETLISLQNKNAEEILNFLILKRADLKKSKDFKAADFIRNSLKNLKIVLEDKKEETIYKVLDE